MFSSTVVIIPAGRSVVAAASVAASLTSDEGRVRYLVIVAGAASIFKGVSEVAKTLDDAGEAVRRELSADARVDALFESDRDGVPAILSADLPQVIVIGDAVPRGNDFGALALELGLPVVWAPSSVVGQLRRIAIPFMRFPAAARLAVRWRRRIRPLTHEVRFVQIARDDGLPTVAPKDAQAILGWSEEVWVDRLKLRLARPVADLGEYLADNQIDMIVVEGEGVGTVSSAVIREAARWLASSRPVAVLLMPGQVQPSLLEARLDSPDLVRAEPLLGFVQIADKIGVAREFEGGSVTLLAEGNQLGTFDVRHGRFEIDGAEGIEVVGLADPEAPNRVDAIARIRSPSDAPIGLVDAAVDAAHLKGLDDARTWWAVRLDDELVFATLRDDYAKHGIDTVIDAGNILDDGHPDDLPDLARSVRLERVARRLVAAGFVVTAVASTGKSGVDVVQLDLQSYSDRLALLTGAPESTLETCEFHIDNRRARESLLAIIDGAQRTLNFQVYIFEDDEVGREIADHLRSAGERGVAVRVLVDSLLSQHLSLGWSNAALEPLQDVEGVTVRAHAPVESLPAFSYLKGRDHRKLVIADGVRAIVGGRNTGRSYYTSFDEVDITPSTAAPDIPWVDFSATISGPMVAQIQASFARAWRDAGGDGLPAVAPGPAGGISARFVCHLGLRDAHVVDAYRAVFDSASDRIVVVNCFPLQFELQQSLLRALTRGVRVRYVVGNPRPNHGERVAFDGWVARELATRLVFGRLDRLVEAGAEVVEVGIAQQSLWSEDIGTIYPHVHAKLASCDGRMLLLGSANVDINSGYWESEGAALIECPSVVRDVETQLDALLEHARLLSTEDETGARSWLSRHWPSAIG